MGLIEFQLLLMILVANGAPILCASLLGKEWNRPLDEGQFFFDGRPLLGPSKTWRGIGCAMTGTTVMAWLLHLPLSMGMTVGCFAMLGDILSSFIKRRLGLKSSSMALGLDQIPEALLPLLAVKNLFEIDSLATLETTTVFFLLELGLSRILYRLHIRKRPY